MTLAHSGMLIHELLNKDPDIVTEEAPLIVLNSKLGVCLAIMVSTPITPGTFQEEYSL